MGTKVEDLRFVSNSRNSLCVIVVAPRRMEVRKVQPKALCGFVMKTPCGSELLENVHTIGYSIRKLQAKNLEARVKGTKAQRSRYVIERCCVGKIVNIEAHLVGFFRILRFPDKVSEQSF